MTWRTHWMIGLNSLWLLTPVLPYVPQDERGLLLVAASLGSLLPDLDASESKIMHLRFGGIKPFFLPAQAVHRTDVHRGMLHSLVGFGFICAITLAAALAIGWLPWIALILGYGSHLLADSATKAGIRMLYPKPNRWHLLPKQLRVTTGSQAEDIILVSAAASGLLLLLYLL